MKFSRPIIDSNALEYASMISGLTSLSITTIFCAGKPAMKNAFHAFQSLPDGSVPRISTYTSLKVGISGKLGSRTILPSSSKAPHVIIGTASPLSTRG